MDETVGRIADQKSAAARWLTIAAAALSVSAAASTLVSLNTTTLFAQQAAEKAAEIEARAKAREQKAIALDLAVQQRATAARDSSHPQKLTGKRL